MLFVVGMMGSMVYAAEQCEPQASEPDSPRTAALKFLTSKPLEPKHVALMAELSATKAQPVVQKPKKKKPAKEVSRSQSDSERLFEHLLKKNVMTTLAFFEPMRETDPHLYAIIVRDKMMSAAMMLSPLLEEKDQRS